MDEEDPNEQPVDNINNEMMTKSKMGTSANALDPRLTVVDNGKCKRMQMDSGCCGMSMLSNPAYFCYGLADGKKINIHTAEKGTAKKAKAYGIAAGSVPTLTDLVTREAGPRKAIRTGLVVCDDAIHDLVNENRFDINLDGTPTPHRVDKKNRCIWMYEGTQEQFIVPLECDRDDLYVDYRPLQPNEQQEFVRANPLQPWDWPLDRPSMTREAIEVRDVNNEVTEYVDEDEIKRQRALKSPKQKKQKERKTTDRRTYKKRDRFVEIDQVLRETSHPAKLARWRRDGEADG